MKDKLFFSEIHRGKAFHKHHECNCSMLSTFNIPLLLCGFLNFVFNIDCIRTGQVLWPLLTPFLSVLQRNQQKGNYSNGIPPPTPVWTAPMVAAHDPGGVGGGG